MGATQDFLSNRIVFADQSAVEQLNNFGTSNFLLMNSTSDMYQFLLDNNVIRSESNQRKPSLAYCTRAWM